MRQIKEIIIHCSATPEGKDYTVADIDRWHRARGFRMIGYHYVIYRDGSIHKGREDKDIGAHVAGHNANSIGICYIGGLNKHKQPKDTRTPEQKKALIELLTNLRAVYPTATIKGHRDCSPDKNNDGIISRKEWIKSCPCFNAQTEYRNL